MRTDVASIANQFVKKLKKIQKGDAIRAGVFLRHVIETAIVLPEGKIVLRWRIPYLFTGEEKIVSKVKWLALAKSGEPTFLRCLCIRYS